MKKTLLIILSILSLFSFTTNAQDYSKGDIDILKHLRKSLYKKFYIPDSLISKKVDPETILPWKSQTFKNSSGIIDSLHETLRRRQYSEYFTLYGFFPKDITLQDCNLFTAKLLSYDLVNEQNEKIQLRAEKLSYFTGQYYKNNDPVRYTFDLKFTPLSTAKAYKGFVEYEITAPTSLNALAIKKSDIGKTITINNKIYTVLSFTKNYIALKCDTSSKELDFYFLGTNSADKKYKDKYTQEKGYKMALGKSSFYMSEEMYAYYLSHPNMTEKELDVYMDEYFKNHAATVVSGERQILILQDIGYIEKMFFYWPNSVVTKRFKEMIDLKD